MPDTEDHDVVVAHGIDDDVGQTGDLVLPRVGQATRLAKSFELVEKVGPRGNGADDRVSLGGAGVLCDVGVNVLHVGARFWRPQNHYSANPSMSARASWSSAA